MGARELYREMTHLPPEQYTSTAQPQTQAQPPKAEQQASATQPSKEGKAQGGAAKPHDPTEYVVGFGGGFLNPEEVEELSDEAPPALEDREEVGGENLEASASPAPGEREEATGEDF